MSVVQSKKDKEKVLSVKCPSQNKIPVLELNKLINNNFEQESCASASASTLDCPPGEHGFDA